MLIDRSRRLMSRALPSSADLLLTLEHLYSERMIVQQRDNRHSLSETLEMTWLLQHGRKPRTCRNQAYLARHRPKVKKLPILRRTGTHVGQFHDCSGLEFHVLALDLLPNLVDRLTNEFGFILLICSKSTYQVLERSFPHKMDLERNEREIWLPRKPFQASVDTWLDRRFWKLNTNGHNLDVATCVSSWISFYGFNFQKFSVLVQY